MNKRILYLVAVSAVVIFVVLFLWQKRKWFTFTDESHIVEVSFPGKPQDDRIVNQDGVSQRVIGYKDKMFFGVGITYDAYWEDSNIVEFERLLIDSGKEILFKRDTVFNNLKGTFYSLKSSNPKEKIEMFNYASNEILITLTVASMKSEENIERKRKFFNSLVYTPSVFEIKTEVPIVSNCEIGFDTILYYYKKHNLFIPVYTEWEPSEYVEEKYDRFVFSWPTTVGEEVNTFVLDVYNNPQYTLKSDFIKSIDKLKKDKNVSKIEFGKYLEASKIYYWIKYIDKSKEDELGKVYFINYFTEDKNTSQYFITMFGTMSVENFENEFCIFDKIYKHINLP